MIVAVFGASRNPDRGRLGIHFSSCVSQAEAVIKLSHGKRRLAVNCFDKLMLLILIAGCGKPSAP